jgi:hypothetical protein
MGSEKYHLAKGVQRRVTSEAMSSLRRISLRLPVRTPQHGDQT